MTSFDATELARRYAGEDTEELLRIGYAQSDEYLPEAVALARDELRRRGVDGPADERVAAAREEETARQKVADEPLDGGVKTLCFLLPSLVGAIIALAHDNRGRRRASRQAWAWTGYGFLMRSALLAAFILLLLWRDTGR